MLRSSLGFHTITLTLSLFDNNETWQLITDFCTYREKTGNIEMYRFKDDEPIIYYPSNYLPPKITIEFKDRYHYGDGNRGIKWCIRKSEWLNDYFDYIVEATINPKILAGINDYLIAATYNDVNPAAANFNKISQEISPLLHSFSNYRITRIDYCVNISLDEILPECDPMRFMNLIKRSDIPPHYEEWMKYDNTAHRMKSRPESFYLKSKSVNINYYSKYLQLLNKSKKNVKKKKPPIDQETLDASRNIYRFEVQCKYHKIYSMSQKAKEAGDRGINKYKSLLDPIICTTIVSDYYKKVIGDGDWYTLSTAIEIIKSKGFNCQREDRLIQALKYVSRCRSLAKAKESCPAQNIDAFIRTLKELQSLNINPVTIPREWHIEYIPNLLRSYFDQLSESNFDHPDQNMKSNYYAAVQHENYYDNELLRGPIENTRSYSLGN